MGYDLHFTRADHWTDSAMYPISLREWIAVADAEPRLTKYHSGDNPPTYEYTAPDGRSWALGWRVGMVTIWKGHDASAELGWPGPAGMPPR